MKIAVISDVHANMRALEAVLDDADMTTLDAIWCLGDIVGYGPQPLEVAIEMQHLYQSQTPEHRQAWLAGNHDMLVTGRISMGFFVDEQNRRTSVSGYNEYAVRLAEDHRNILKHRDNIMTWLNELPTSSNPFAGIYLAHAAYRHDDIGALNEYAAYQSYVSDKSGADLLLSDFIRYSGKTTGLLMGGHSHVSGIWYWDPGQQGATRAEVPSCIDLNVDLAYVNVGSVGIPRHPDRCPTYALLTTDEYFRTVKIVLRSVAYDVSAIDFHEDYPDIYRQQMMRCLSEDEMP